METINLKQLKSERKYLQTTHMTKFKISSLTKEKMTLKYFRHVSKDYRQVVNRHMKNNIKIKTTMRYLHFSKESFL